MKSILIPLLLITFSLTVPQAQGAEWITVGLALGDNKFFYDNETLTKLPDDIIKFWEKIEYSDKQKKEYIKWRTGKKYDIARYDTLTHTLNLIEVNCRTRESRTMMAVDYSSVFGALSSNTHRWQPSEGWSPIIPDSMMEKFYKALCSSQEKK